MPDRQTDRQADRETDRQTVRQIQSERMPQQASYIRVHGKGLELSNLTMCGGHVSIIAAVTHRLVHACTCTYLSVATCNHQLPVDLIGPAEAEICYP